MGLRSFEYVEATCVADACAALGEYGDDARAYAGGTSLLLLMKQGILRPRYLVNVKKIPGLRHIVNSGSTVRIGALTTHHDLETSSVIATHFPVITETEPFIANIRVRSTATIGGNLAFAEPLTDLPPIFIALEGTASIQGHRGTRTMPVEALFAGYYETTLAPDELLTEVQLPVSPPGFGLAYLRFSAGSDKPSVGCAVGIQLDGDRRGCTSAKVVLGCVAPTPLRVHEAELLLIGKEFRREIADDVAALAAAACSPLSDLRGSEEYKRSIVAVLTRRAVQAAFQDASRR